MKLAMETNYLRKVYGSVGAFRMIKEAGFDAADVSLYNLPEDDDFINRPDRRDYALSLREEADKLGLTFCQAHAAFKYKFGEPRDSKAYTDIIRSMEFASYLGVPHIIVHSTKCPHVVFYKG